MVVGQLADVFFVEKQRLVGPHGIFGQAVAEPPFGKAQVSAKIFIDVIRKIEVALARIVEGNKKVTGVDDVA